MANKKFNQFNVNMSVPAVNAIKIANIPPITPENTVIEKTHALIINSHFDIKSGFSWSSGKLQVLRTTLILPIILILFKLGNFSVSIDVDSLDEVGLANCFTSRYNNIN